MAVPVIQGLPLFLFPIVALVDSGHSGPRAAYVVQHGFGDFEPHPETLKIGRERAPQIVEAPRR